MIFNRNTRIHDFDIIIYSRRWLIITWLISLSIHEFSHAFVAYRVGDYTLLKNGYLSLNIINYIDPLFSVIVPLLTMLLFGGLTFPGGAVYINLSNVKPKRCTLCCYILFAIPFCLVSKDLNLYWGGCAAAA